MDRLVLEYCSRATPLLILHDLILYLYHIHGQYPSIRFNSLLLISRFQMDETMEVDSSGMNFQTLTRESQEFGDAQGTIFLYVAYNAHSPISNQLHYHLLAPHATIFVIYRSKYIYVDQRGIHGFTWAEVLSHRKLLVIRLESVRTSYKWFSRVSLRSRSGSHRFDRKSHGHIRRGPSPYVLHPIIAY